MRRRDRKREEREKEKERSDGSKIRQDKVIR